MELTMENLIEAANDITKVCGLQPPINTKFETKATGGGALTSAKNKFIKNLRMEIQVISECQDSESGEFDLQEGDVPLLKKETLEVIREISEKAAERLNFNDILSGVAKEIISEETEKTEGEVKPGEIEKPKKSRKFSAKQIILTEVKKEIMTRDEIIKTLENKVPVRLIKLYLGAWKSGDRCPIGSKLIADENGVLKFKE